MVSIRNFLPNAITLANLACGLYGILSVLQGQYQLAAIMVCGSLLFDFMDGLVARALGVSSDIGLQLDSLADVVSFGVSPGFLMYHLLGKSVEGHPGWVQFLPILSFLIPLFSALRLAKFNVDTRQTSYFIGLPTPANALFHYSIALWILFSESDAIKNFLTHPAFLVALIVLSSALLVANIPLMSLKVKSLSWHENAGRVYLLIGIVVLLLLLGFPALVFIIPLYLLISLIFKPDRE